MEKDMTYFKVKDALEGAKECFLCTLEDEIERRYMETYLYELVMDAPSRKKIIESRGFCNHHYYKMLIEASKPQISEELGMALVLRSVVEQLIQDIHKQSEKIKGAVKVEKQLRQILSSEGRCPACIHMEEFGLMYIEEFLEIASRDDQPLLKLFESTGLCLPHYVTVLDVALNLEKKDESTIKMIIKVEEANLRKTGEKLAQYIKSQDYRFSREKFDEEIIFKAVSKLAGRRGIRPIVMQK